MNPTKGRWNHPSSFYIVIQNLLLQYYSIFSGILVRLLQCVIGFILHRCRPYGALFYWCCRFLHRCRPYGAEDGFYGIIRFLSRDSEIPPMILFNFQLSVGIRSSFLPLAIGSPSAVSSQLLSVGIRSSLLPLAIGSPSAISNQLLSVGIRSSLLQKRRGSEISSAGKVKRCG